MYRLLFFITLVFIVSCKSEDKTGHDHKKNDRDSTDIVSTDSLDTITIISDYNLNGVDPKLRAEFKQNLANIEREHGVQWDFCTCTVKNDSINKAFQQPNLPDKDFNRLSDRFDVIDQRCKAFLAQNPNHTPEDRARHEKKVRDCLKNAKNK